MKKSKKKSENKKGKSKSENKKKRREQERINRLNKIAEDRKISSRNLTIGEIWERITLTITWQVKAFFHHFICLYSNRVYLCIYAIS